MKDFVDTNPFITFWVITCITIIITHIADCFK
jgi:hypothetical protein